ncbi:MAG: agmatine deiminase family protein [Prevotellaceae bacterium]|jgi:agmatine/peptidylarginine deiminase|nr:agmatine deiminase family protein [Prevotellaceae bacterium]
MSTSKHIILPAEWAEQEFVQLILPHEDTDWYSTLDEVNKCYAHIALEISKRQKLLVVCNEQKSARNLLKNCNLQNITFAELPCNDTWARDTAAITVLEDNRPTLLDFTFNGWGLKFAANLDNLITNSLYKNGYFPEKFHYKDCRNFVLEGGSIESDGQGSILTTTKCLLSENRNYLSKSEIEEKLKAYFGAKRILWLEHGYLAGDDTDSHIDTLARFCDDNTIAYVSCTDKNDEHFEELKAMENELKQFRTAAGAPYKLVALPMTDTIIDTDCRLPATYANFLIINGAVLLPTYDVPQDDVAAQILQTAFPDREIVKINCVPLIRQHGSLHCVTMQFPR